jgi:uncharacterized protein YndB with AHSA1/START domain
MISIKKELLIEASQETAFQVFNQKIDAWWPRSHHIGKTPMVKMVLEPKAQGRWYSLHQNGEESEVGYVQTFEPNSRLVLVWQINGEFKFDSSLRTQVEICFIPEGSNKTLMKFEHRNLESLGKAVESMDQGWAMILDLFAETAKTGKLNGERLKSYERHSMG